MPKSVEALLPQLSPQSNDHTVHLLGMDRLTVSKRKTHGEFPVGSRDLIEGEFRELLLDFDLRILGEVSKAVFHSGPGAREKLCSALESAFTDPL
jgi:hypothetical protein